jgi:hypothetical protein
MSDADGRLEAALPTYLEQTRNNPVRPFTTQGMCHLRSIGCDVIADFHLDGSICSGGFSKRSGFVDHVRKLGSSAGSRSKSGHLHSVLFKVMFGDAPPPKKPRTLGASSSLQGEEVSLPIMLLLELHADASEEVREIYCSKGRLQEHFNKFPPSHHVPVYGPGGFMRQAVLVYQPEAGQLLRTYANAQVQQA